MQPPQHATFGGVNVIVLDELRRYPCSGQNIATTCLRKKTPIVVVFDGFDQ